MDICLKKKKKNSDPHSKTSFLNEWSGITCNAFIDHQGAIAHPAIKRYFGCCII